MTDPDKRARDRRYNARRPFSHSWYKQPEWCHPISGRRALQLKAEPNCRMCAKRGVITPARHVDHVDRHGGDPVKFWQGELQSLCDHDHNSVKQSLERGNRAGCDESGMPTDPAHPWGTCLACPGHRAD